MELGQGIALLANSNLNSDACQALSIIVRIVAPRLCNLRERFLS